MPHYYHNFRSRSQKWARTCNIWPFVLDLFRSAWWSPVPHIFLQIQSHLCGWVISLVCVYGWMNKENE
jgi:hypothetical protein